MNKHAFPSLVSSFVRRSLWLRRFSPSPTLDPKEGRPSGLGHISQPELQTITGVGNGTSGSGNVSSLLLLLPPPHVSSLYLTLSTHPLRCFYLHELINPSLCRTFIHLLSLHRRLCFIQEAKQRIYREGTLGKEPFVTGLKEQLPVWQSAAYW